MWILIILSFFIWMLLARYMLSFSVKSSDGVYQKSIKLIEKAHKNKVQDLFGIIKDRVAVDEKIILSLIAVAPLLGLLGTVCGMIETFASLETMEMFKPGGGIADGISQALMTTQMGLIVAVPSMLAFKWVQKEKKKIINMINQEINLRMKQNEI